MDRDISDIKRLFDRLIISIDRIVTQTDQVEEELRNIRILLSKMNDNSVAKDKNKELNSKRW